MVHTQQNREYYTWDEFDKDCELIAEWARKHNFKNIYGIPRGGVALALTLSHLLSDLPMIFDSYSIHKKTLVVDDIVDSGATLFRLRGLRRCGFKSVSLYVGDCREVEPDFYLHKKKKEWVVFPWETDETSKYDGTLF